MASSSASASSTRRGDLPVVVLTAFGSFETAVAAIRAGAYDFISKPVQLDVLAIALRRAAQHRALHDEVKRLRLEVGHPSRIENFIGQSPPMARVHDLIAQVADSEASVLITGESGTGKEVVARALHRQSRRQGAFVAVNCAAMPEALLESELFGHVRGAFTDAREARSGLFVEARRGTLFLDEIGDMPLGLQPKLLRVLQERTVRPVGGSGEIPIDVRILAATNRDLESAIEERRFREDLFFRINVIQIPLPPLRARVGDILPLAQHYLAQIAARAGKSVTAISPPAAAKLLAYPWPGNVRELVNCVERAVALARHEQIVVDDLPDKVQNHRSSQLVLGGDDPVRARAHGRGGEALHPARARRRGRQQDRRGPHPRLRAQDALPQAGALRRRPGKGGVARRLLLGRARATGTARPRRRRSCRRATTCPNDPAPRARRAAGSRGRARHAPCSRATREQRARHRHRAPPARPRRRGRRQHAGAGGRTSSARRTSTSRRSPTGSASWCASSRPSSRAARARPSISSSPTCACRSAAGSTSSKKVHLSRYPTPVLLMTAFGEQGLESRVRELGGRLLDKPFTPLALRKTVRELLGRG